MLVGGWQRAVGGGGAGWLVGGVCVALLMTLVFGCCILEFGDFGGLGLTLLFPGLTWV